MASSVNADNGVVSGTAGLKSSADNSGVLDLQTNGTTAISISASQVVTFANQPAYTGGTANGVLYLNGSKVLTSGSALTFNGTNTVTLNASAANLTLGISTNYGLITATGTNPASIYFNGGSRTGFESHLQYFATNHVFFNETGGSEIMRLLNTGNVGIGTASPASKLHIQSATGTAETLIKLQTAFSNPSGNKSIVWADNSNTLGAIAVNYSAPQTSMTFGSLYNSGYNTTDLMTLTPTGLGIGTSSPVAKLQIKGSGTSGQVTASFILENSSSGTAGMDITGSAGASYLRFLYGGGPSTGTNALTETMRIGLEGASAGVQQIKFASTQVASSDANTLDDYEEGTFTPAFAAGTFTYGTRTGFYTKVGRLVTVNFFVIWSAKSGSGTLSVNGFPFTSTAAASYRATGAVGYTAGVGFSAGTQITWAMSQNYVGADLAIVISGAATQFADVSNMSAAGEIQGTISYIV
jgi:hypothetical protein